MAPHTSNAPCNNLLLSFRVPGRRVVEPPLGAVRVVAVLTDQPRGCWAPGRSHRPVEGRRKCLRNCDLDAARERDANELYRVVCAFSRRGRWGDEVGVPAWGDRGRHLSLVA